MTFDITSSVDPRMLVLRAHGTGTSAEGHRAFLAVQRHPDFRQGMPLLVDVTALDYAPSADEARLFAGLFATAFPCSLLALLCNAASHTAAREISILAAGRGASVAAFTRLDDARAWMTGQAAPSVAAPVAVPTSRRAPLHRRVADGVVIPYNLRDRIESAVLDVNGEGCSLRLDSTAGWPADEPDFAELTVSTDHAGATSHATVDIRVSHLDDEDYVVASVITAMQAVLAGAPAGAAATGSTARR
ncbi:MAG: hypothetical protein ABJC51_11065 [Acidobacteriota bacterium]